MPPEVKLQPSSSVPQIAARAASIASEQGGSPAVQLKAAKLALRMSGDKKKQITYLPHQGNRQRQRAIAKMAGASA